MNDEELDRALRIREDRVPLHPFSAVERRARSTPPLRPVLGVAALAAVLVVGVVVGLQLPELRQAAAPATTPSGAASQTATPTARPVTMGQALFSMPASAEMTAFTSDGEVLVAAVAPPRRTGDLPGLPTSISIARPGPPTWRTVYTAEDGYSVMSWGVVAGRLATLEQRISGQLGVDGRWTRRVLVRDLEGGTSRVIDEFSGPLGFDGGGGGRRPSPRLVLGSDAVAWTRIARAETAEPIAELRVTSLTGEPSATLIASSAKVVLPIAVGGGRLVYVIGLENEDQLRVHDLRTGTERVLATDGQVDRGFAFSFIAMAAVGGDWAVWKVDQARFGQGGGRPATAPPRPQTSLQAVNIVTGERRDLGELPRDCLDPTAGRRAIAVACHVSSPRLYATEDLEFLTLFPDPAVGRPSTLQASGDGVIVVHGAGGDRRVTLVRFTTGPPR